MIGLLETKVKEANAMYICKKFRKNWNWKFNYGYHDKGRIWVGWRQDKCSLEVWDTQQQLIATKITPISTGESFHVIFVYGLHSVRDRRELWPQLLRENHDIPCLFIGDFNAIYKQEHRKNGSLVTSYERYDMHKWMDDMELHPLPERGHKFSWSNKEKGDNRILTKIDHAIGILQWMDRYSQASVCYANPQTSDHTPLLLILTRHYQKGNKPFRFFNYICDHQDFLQVVRESWNATNIGTGMQRIWYKLKNVKSGLKKLHTKEFAGIHGKITDWECILDRVQSDLQATPMDDDLHQREQDAINQVKKWRKIENKALQQKARMNWMDNGDENTAYFHATIKERRASNTIYELQDAEGKWHSNTDTIHSEVSQYFQKLQGTEHSNLQMIDINTMRHGPQLDSVDSQFLIQDVSEDEIKEALFRMDDNKAPGVDGFNALFFKRTWDIIKQDLIYAIQEFFNNNILFHPFNCTSLTLIPKSTNAKKVEDYRPIACCTVVYKIISRILAGRIHNVIAKVIDTAQSGFIPGRHMSDNILLAAELIKGYSRNNNSSRCMIKMDLRKAYDSISWVFLFSVMEEMGFPPRFMDWVKPCVSTVSFSPLVNGTLLKPFPAKKGLRQGDPISPYLFAIAMEYLSRIMHKLKDNPGFHYHPRCRKVNITHLLFADDLLLFCRADLSSVCNVMRSFECFSRASGLRANTRKSNIFMAGVDQHHKDQIKQSLQMDEGILPFRYLGVPLHSKKLNARECRPLVDKIVGRINCWSSRLLSYAGRLQLVRSVIGGVKNFWAQIFCIPKKLIKMIEGIYRTFIWTGKDGVSKKVAAAWSKVVLPYSKGVLNLKDMYI